MIILSILGLIFILPNVLIGQPDTGHWYLDSYCYPRCLSEEMQELANQLHDTCVGETGTNDAAIENARHGNFEDSDSFKCYIKCLLDQMAIIDDDGIIDVDAMVAVLPDELKKDSEPIIRKCDTQKGANPCENAWLTHKCYYKEGPDVYFLI